MSPNDSSNAQPTLCPCGSNKSYAQCCEPAHKGEPAVSAEALMRSRYSAFCLGLSDYIQSSWHSSTRPKHSNARDEAVKPQWIGLRIRRHEIVDDDHARVEFAARYKVGDRMFTMREISRFVRENGHWFYLDGTFPRH